MTARPVVWLAKRYEWPLWLVGFTTAVMIFAVPAAMWLLPDGRNLAQPILTSWAIWDAPHYLELAAHGYVGMGEAANYIVFLPLLPAMIWLVHWYTFGDVTIAAYVVSLLACAASACLLYELVWRDAKAATARRAVLFLLLFPTSIFLHLPYTESLFLALVLGVFLSLRERKYYLAFGLAALLTATRIQGVVMIPVILLELWMYHRPVLKTRPYLGVLAVVIPSLGLAVYFMLNYKIFGSPVHFLSVQREHWSMIAAPPWVGLKGVIENWHTWQGLQMFLLVQAQLIAAGLALAATIYAFIKIRPSYALYAFGILVSSTATSNWFSVPRYVLVIFPIYIMLAYVTRKFALYLLATGIMGGLWLSAVLIGIEHGQLF